MYKNVLRELIRCLINIESVPRRRRIFYAVINIRGVFHKPKQILYYCHANLQINYCGTHQYVYQQNTTLFYLLYSGLENIPGHAYLPIVQTVHGIIEGKTVTSKDGRYSHEYIGIPYATPPLGRLRFQKPEPYTGRWSGKYTVLKLSSINRRVSLKCFTQGADV